MEQQFCDLVDDHGNGAVGERGMKGHDRTAQAITVPGAVLSGTLATVHSIK